MTPSSGLRDEIHQMHAHLCSSLADPNRILLLYTLSQAPASVSDLARETGMPQPSVSRQLRVLRESGLVNSQRDAHSVIYRLADERVIEALDILRGVLAAALKRQGALAMTAAQTHLEKA
ncbi:MAG: metalloregulator ArsR/SmtB family transcription factor [Anaerolineales bacterium]